MGNDKSLKALASAESCVYTSCYCEENVWHLADYIRKTIPEEISKCHVVPLWCQKASENGFVIWDYHVILIHEDERGRVYDLDSILPFPCDYAQYSSKTFQSDDHLKQEFHRQFRVIDAELYLERFSSDRSHMLSTATGNWLKPPPSYSCIQTPNSTNNLQDFISMDPNLGIGQVMTLDQLNQKFNLN